MTPELSPCRTFLERDPVLYLDLTEPVRRGRGRVLYASPTGALVSIDDLEPDRVLGFSLSASDWPTARRLFALLPADPGLLIIHEAFYVSELARQLHLTFSPSCRQGAYLLPTPPPLPETEYTVGPLSESHLSLLLSNYAYGSETYLRQLLAHDSLFGAFDGDELLGFIGRHAEGSMGLLEVLPPYRRRGVATLLESWLIRHELSLDHVPYCQVFEDNAPSLSLQRSLGLEFSRGSLCWAQSA